eukprot:TRINITY_DN17145_c0_g1_i1.p1 TRINITY_DN17145_c0_g1~~TRINITY_DN17145_c0_g1_i1.p1  ORF type:complete len:321 (+),score=98.12 TRINITY_DN17145_c0_g1_i1:97-963(+)
MEDSSAELQRAGELLRAADCVIIAAGAGLSVAAGIDYTDEHLFRTRYPAMARMGFRCCYEMIGNPALMRDPRLMWGYNAPHSRWMLTEGSDDPTYRRLHALVADRPHFVITTNVDHLFERNGFDPKRVYTPQGSYGKLQCMDGCRHVFDARPEVDRLLKHVDPGTQRLEAGVEFPSCPNCGGNVFFNLNGGSWYVADHWKEAKRSFAEFANSAVRRGKRLVILEIGVGFNTPGVIRWPMEALAAQGASVSIVRINPEAPELDHPGSIPADRFVGVRSGAAAAVAALAA